jgi:hypothetical protein
VIPYSYYYVSHPYLEYYVRLAEEMQLNMEVTLTVNGLLIEGFVISQEYYEEIWSILTGPRQVSDEGGKDADIVDSSLRDFIKAENEKTRTSLEYIYLKDAKVYFDSKQSPIPTNAWVGKLSSIDGFPSES